MVAVAAARERRAGGGVVKDLKCSQKVQPPHPANTQQALAFPTPRRTDRILYASDCSGLDGGAVAMARVRPGFIHWFASEVEPRFRKCFEKIHPDCLNVFEDVNKRDLKPLVKFRQAHPDLPFVYTSGFPCQPFSTDGLMLGGKDQRTAAAESVATSIAKLMPDLFILENVPTLVERLEFKSFFSKFLKKLLKNDLYYIDFQILDSSDYGVPASRRRVYIVGVRRDRLCQSWSWPATVPTPPLSSVLEPRFHSSSKVDTLSKTGLRNLAGALQKIKVKYPGTNPSSEPFVP